MDALNQNEQSVGIVVLIAILRLRMMSGKSKQSTITIHKKTITTRIDGDHETETLTNQVLATTAAERLVVGDGGIMVGRHFPSCHKFPSCHHFPSCCHFSKLSSFSDCHHFPSCHHHEHCHCVQHVLTAS